MSTWPEAVTVPRNRSFQELFERVCAQLGINKRTGPSGAEAQDRLINAINSAWRWVWEWREWQESTTIQSWPASLHPDTGTPFVPRTYLLMQINALFGIYTTHPLADQQHSQTVPYLTGPDGFYLTPTQPPAPDTVWLWFRPDPWEFTGEVYSATQAYGYGDLTWYKKESGGGGGDGHAYAFIGNSPLTGTAPLNNDGSVNANWQQRPVLFALLPIVQCAAAAYWYESHEKFASSAALLQKAEQLLNETGWRACQQENPPASLP